MKYQQLHLLNFNDALQFNTIYEKLKSQSLDCVVFDYISFHYTDQLRADSFINQRRKLGSPNIFEYECNDRKLSNPDIYTQEEKSMISFYQSKSIKSLYHAKSKQSSMKYDIILSRDNFYKNGTLVYRNNYIRICGQFAEIVFQSLMSKKIVIIEYDLKITRLDLNLDLFTYHGFNQDNFLFQEFRTLLENISFDKQKMEPVRWDGSGERDKSRFSIFYLNSRNSRRMVRCYLSEKEKKISFEIEFKRESAKRFRRDIYSSNFLEFNKSVVLEVCHIYDLFSTIQCEFIQPLHDWYHSYLSVIQNIFFKKEKLYKRKSTLNTTNSVLVPIKTRTELTIKQLTNPKMFFFSKHTYDLLNDLNLDHQKTSRLLLLLGYLNNKILQVLNKNCDGCLDSLYREVNGFILDQDFFQNSIHNFKLTILLEDLVGFLGLTYSTYSRNLVIQLLKFLLQSQVTIRTETFVYHAHLITALFTKLIRGQPASVDLWLNPFLICDLKNPTIGFNQSVHQKYFQSLQKNSNRNVLPSYAESLFIRTLVGLSFKDDEEFKKVFLLKDLNHYASRVNLCNHWLPLLTTLELSMSLSVGFVKFGDEILPFSKNLAEKIILPRHHKKINQLFFLFENLQKSTKKRKTNH